jgi:hypothetical protein
MDEREDQNGGAVHAWIVNTSEKREDQNGGAVHAWMRKERIKTVVLFMHGS